MAITPDFMDTTRIRRTMRVLPYEEGKAGATRYIEGSLGESDELTDWDLSFEEYIEEHNNSKLLFCWYAELVINSEIVRRGELVVHSGTVKRKRQYIPQ